jgi:hypothetical protein
LGSESRDVDCLCKEDGASLGFRFGGGGSSSRWAVVDGGKRAQGQQQRVACDESCPQHSSYLPSVAEPARRWWWWWWWWVWVWVWVCRETGLCRVCADGCKTAADGALSRVRLRDEDRR